MVQPDGSIRVDHSGIVVSTDYRLADGGGEVLMVKKFVGSSG